MFADQYQVILNEQTDAQPFERCIIIGLDCWVSVDGDRFRAVSPNWDLCDDITEKEVRA